MSCELKRKSWVVPFGGNSFITAPAESPSTEANITSCGVENWKSAATKISLYFHSQNPSRVMVALRLSVPEGSSRINFTLAHHDNSTKQFKLCTPDNVEMEIRGAGFHLENCGIFDIPVAGYMKLDISGVTRTGTEFATVSDVVLIEEESEFIEENFMRFVDDPEDFYFGRRGPSVHMGYHLEANKDYEYFYNEIYVPRGQDVIGAYYCAMGFTGGYFGIQVNSTEERRILFSIWSEYNSDDPEEIPEEFKVKLIRSGEGVYVGEFGNEGAGAQSYLKYMWEPETVYKFIVLARPLDADRTMYTAWFNNGTSWNLIASFDKPKVSMYFKSPYSFSENFSPSMGYVERHCVFQNQWGLDVDGNWSEINTAKFTADAAANAEIRMDVAGGVGIDGDRTKFYLRNCGFFSDRVVPGTEFERQSNGSLPPVDVSLLP